MTGASRFPRHWVYDADGRLSHKSGLTDFRDWYRNVVRPAQPVGRRGLPGPGHGGGDGAGTVAVGAAHARRRQAEDQPAAGRRRAGPPGRARHRRLPGPGRGRSGWSGTASGWPSTGRARCSASGPTWRAAIRTSTLVAVTACRVASVDASQLDRSRPGGTVRRAPARRRRPGLTVRLYLCGVRGSTPAPGADFLRYGGHTSCVAIAHDDAAAPALVLDAGTGLRRVTPLLAGRPFDGTILLTHLHWDHVHGLPFFTGGDRDDARVTPAAARAGRTAPARRRCWPGACRRRTSRSGRATCAAPGRSAPSRPGQLKAEGFTVEAREIPHKGGGRSATGSATGSSCSPTSPITARRCSGRARTAGASITDAALDLASGADLLIHDALPAARGGARRRPRSATRRPTTRSAWASGPGPGGSCCPTTSRTGPTTSSTGWRRAASPRAAVPVIVAAEGGILEL